MILSLHGWFYFENCPDCLGCSCVCVPVQLDGRRRRKEQSHLWDTRWNDEHCLEIIPWWCFVIRLCSSCCAEQIFPLGRKRKAGGGAQTGGVIVPQLTAE